MITSFKFEKKSRFPGTFTSFKAMLFLCPGNGVLQSTVAHRWSIAVIHQQGSLTPWWILVLHHRPKGWQERKCFKQASFINCFNLNERKKWFERVWMSKKTRYIFQLCVQLDTCKSNHQIFLVHKIDYYFF